jgi:hypothetical protein
VNLLDGLGKLLELLSNCFNVTLGEKLLEHLKNFADPETVCSFELSLRLEAVSSLLTLLCAMRLQLQKMRYEAANDKSSTNRIRPEDEVKIAASIIDLYRLLPPMPSNTQRGLRKSRTD